MNLIVEKQEELNQLSTLNDDFFLMQLLLEEKLEIKLKKNISDAKKKSLIAFRKKFVPAYIIEKAAFVDIRKVLLHHDWWPVKTYEQIGMFRYERCKLPQKVKVSLQKQSGSAPAEVINAVAAINDDPFSDSLKAGVFDAAQQGGDSTFIIFDINQPFNLRDTNVEAFLEAYELRLAKAITEQISTSIQFEILEGVRAGEGIPQIAKRITGVWDKPIDVVVPPRLDASGNVIRAGYSYKLSNEAWAVTTARTETARGFIEGKIDGYKQTGIVKSVIFVTTPDERLCPACNALEGAEFKLENAGGIIPVHASCRCTFLPKEEISNEIKDQAEANVEALLV